MDLLTQKGGVEALKGQIQTFLRWPPVLAILVSRDLMVFHRSSTFLGVINHVKSPVESDFYPEDSEPRPLIRCT